MVEQYHIPFGFIKTLIRSFSSAEGQHPGQALGLHHRWILPSSTQARYSVTRNPKGRNRDLPGWPSQRASVSSRARNVSDRLCWVVGKEGDVWLGTAGVSASLPSDTCTGPPGLRRTQASNALPSGWRSDPPPSPPSRPKHQQVKHHSEKGAFKGL